MQYKNKKNLYKLVFITILLGFIISLVGCNWLSLGLLNIFDPQQNLQIKDVIIGEDGKADITVFSLNEVASNITEFQFEYYNGSTKLSSNYNRTVNIGSFYVAPTSSPGTPGDETTFNLTLYSDDILKYARDNYAYGVITCELYIVGEDLAGHKINKKIPGKLPALGIDSNPPTADIVVTPASGDCPLTVFFDGSGSNDGDGVGIAKYEWYLPQVSSSIMSTEMSFSKELACSLIPATDSDEVITVNLTVIDYHGNEDSASESVTITRPESTDGCGT